MRSLQREKRSLYISQPLPPEPILDADGNDTGAVCSVFDEPVLLSLNLKPITSQLERQAFGADVKNVLKAEFTPYDVDGYDISEGCIAWINVAPNGTLNDADLVFHPMNYNYTVEQVLDTGGQTTAYFKKIVGAAKA